MRAVSIVFFSFVIIGMALPAQAGKKRLKIQVTKKDVDLENRKLYFKINRPIDSAEIKVFTPEGKLIHEKVELYDGAAANTRLSISWPDLLQHSDNFRIELKVTDVDNYWVGWQIIRFYLEIPHEEVVFETAKWDIRPSEEHKLVEPTKLLLDAIRKYGKLMECKLYVAGHTDTVDTIAYNRDLSRKRARSIAKYFIEHGIKGIPVFIRGFGEELLAVETGDSVPEEKNRRAQYILSTFPPEMSGPGSWQQIK